MDLFATGFPGFIARTLLPRLVRDGDFERVVLLVEERFRAQAEPLARELFAGHPVEVVAGDITRPGLGIGKDARERLSRRPAQWWHLAAIYRLEVGLDLARRVNVEGTRHVVELAREAAVDRLHYVSTAYVSGSLTGRVMEDDLPRPRPGNFKNFYELTKNEAEWVVRGQMTEVPTTIYRFGVVTGDSRTGDTTKFDGPYFTIKYLDRWGGLPLPMIGKMDARINIVPIDYVLAAAGEISRQQDSAGKCFQIVDPDPITTGELFEVISRELGYGAPRWTISPEGMDRVMRYSLVRRLVGLPRQAMAYINHHVEYDCTNTTRALEGTGIVCPSARDYLPVLVRFYKENQHRKELHMDVR